MNSKVEIMQEDIRKSLEGSEVFRLICNNSLIKELTGYDPKCSLDEGLKKTIKWFSNTNNIKKYKHDIYNV